MATAVKAEATFPWVYIASTPVKLVVNDGDVKAGGAALIITLTTADVVVPCELVAITLYDVVPSAVVTGVNVFVMFEKFAQVVPSVDDCH